MLLKFMAIHLRPISTHLSAWFHRPMSQQQGMQLRNMSDLELRDLGVGRGEIPFLLNTKATRHVADIWGNRYPS